MKSQFFKSQRPAINVFYKMGVASATAWIVVLGARKLGFHWTLVIGIWELFAQWSYLPESPRWGIDFGTSTIVSVYILGASRQFFTRKI